MTQVGHQWVSLSHESINLGLLGWTRVVVQIHLADLPLQTLHLPRMQRLEVLLPDVDAPNLVANNIGLDVLLRPRLELLGPLERLPHRRLVRLADAPDPKVYPRAHLLDLDPRQLLAAPL